jgi:UDP-2,3-diacylglucosamine pyrophosphatase LpxH
MTGPTYFFSDVHFQGRGSRSDARFLDCLNELNGAAHSIYFVGDLLDFWIGYRGSHGPYEPLWSALSSLIDNGTQIHYLTGNHDPAPVSMLTGMGVHLHTEGQVVTLGDRHIWMEHGDLVDPSSGVRRWICRMARNPLVLGLARLVPAPITWAAANRYTSRPHRYDRPLHPNLRQGWFQSKMDAGYNTVIIGHYHRAVNHRSTTRHNVQQLIALGDWLNQMTFARFDGRLELLRYASSDMGSTVVPTGDHCPPADFL